VFRPESVSRHRGRKMRKEDLFFVLGAADPEMQAIEELLRDCGVQYAYATVGGVRVHPGNAYKADGYITPDGIDCVFADADWQGSFVLVECHISNRFPKIVVDHHRPGDPSYGKGPSKFWRASSLGQVWRLLGSLECFSLGASPDDGDTDAFLVATYGEDNTDPHMIPNAALIAAADHCLAAAYRGECPGVNPDALMAWRVRSRSDFQGRPESEVIRDIEAARVALRDADQIPLGVRPSLPTDPRSPGPVPARKRRELNRHGA